LTQQVIEEVRNYFKEKVFEAVVPRSVKMCEAPSFGKPAVLYDPSNKASKCYEAMGGEFVRRFTALDGGAPAVEEQEQPGPQHSEAETGA